MLRQLHIRDFVIVEQLDLAFSSGFTALTGETGAGKSILIDALALLLGERADPEVVRVGAPRADLSACFEIGTLSEVRAWLAEHDLAAGEDLLLRRVIEPGGRSRAYINGVLATVQQLRHLGRWLVDVHGQHAHQSLLRADAQRALLDRHAGLASRVASLSALFRTWRNAQEALEAAMAQSEAAQQVREQLLWQIAELDALALASGEWTALVQEHARLAHATSLIEGVRKAQLWLSESDGAALAACEQAEGVLSELTAFDPALSEIVALLSSAAAEMSEAVRALSRYADRAELDPARLSELDARMASLMAFARKYRVKPEMLPALLQEWQGRLAELDAAVDLPTLQWAAEQAEQAYRLEAAQLSDARAVAAQALGTAVTAQMAGLALANGRFEVKVSSLPQPGPSGLDQVEFRIAGLAAQEARSLAKVASGGELSRISLAIQVVTAQAGTVPTLIFDEVDVGIGGGVAEQVGALLRDLGRSRQILCVTHLAQVAAKANQQWLVKKTILPEGARSDMVLLDEAARVTELARMMGGIELSEASRAHAYEMLRSTLF